MRYISPRAEKTINSGFVSHHNELKTSGNKPGQQKNCAKLKAENEKNNQLKVITMNALCFAVLHIVSLLSDQR